MLPVRQFAAVQFLKHAGLDLGVEELVRRHHEVVTRMTCQQFGFQRFVGVEGVPRHLDACLFGKVLGHGRQDVVRPVVHPQLTLICLCRASHYRQPADGSIQYAFQCIHDVFPQMA